LVNYGLSLNEINLMTDKWQILLLFLAFPDALNQNKQERVKKSVKWQCFSLKFGECLLQTLAGSSVSLNEGFKWISSAPPGNAEPVSLLGHHHILSKFSQMRHSLVILTLATNNVIRVIIKKKIITNHQQSAYHSSAHVQNSETANTVPSTIVV
jgi:hypothetical protein